MKHYMCAYALDDIIKRASAQFIKQQWIFFTAYIQIGYCTVVVLDAEAAIASQSGIYVAVSTLFCAMSLFYTNSINSSSA